MTNIAVDVRNVTKCYCTRNAVDGISFTIQAGEIFGLLGPNGAGKSTTIKMLSGLTKATSGTIGILGSTWGKDNRHNMLNMVGVVPQNIALYPTLSAWDNLSFFGRIYGYSGKELQSKIQRALNIVGLCDRAHDIVDKYSGGMQRRLNLAIGLIHEPPVLFLDEPTVGVDPQSRNAIFESILELNKSGVTIIYTTHYMEEAQKLCDRVAIMDMGKIIAIDSVESLCSSIGGFIQITAADRWSNLVIDSIKSALNISHLVVDNQNLTLESHNLHETLTKCLEIINRNGVGISNLQMFEPNLESVFLKLTGKQLRDISA